MKDLTKKVETLKKRLDELGGIFNSIKKSLLSDYGKQRRLVRV